MKVFILLLVIIAAVIELTQSATLRRKPKVYNALITTDQNLTPSRAFPVIQPHLQETYAYPSYSYRSYSPLGLYNNGFPYRSPAASYNGFHSYPRLNPGLVEARNFFPRDEIHTTLPPTSNEFGLPPSLVPINSFPFGNLAPYPYHSYPIVYDQFGGYGGYLPPYPFYPPGFEPPGKDKKDAKSKDDEKDEKKDEKQDDSNSAGDGKEDSDDKSPAANDDSGSPGSNSDGSTGDSSSSTNKKSSRLRNFDKPEFLQQQSWNENIKNFPNKDPTIPDIDPSPPVRVKPLSN